MRSPRRAATRWACASSTSTPTTRSARSPASRPRAPPRPKPPEATVLDLRLIREQPEAVARALADKGGAELIEQIAARDAERRRLVKEADELKALRNRVSEAIGQ